jgi:uncharacterized C2H2 Zn-finger protein
MAAEKSQKVAKIYECKKCDYLSCNKSDYAKHLETKKHNGLHPAAKKSQKSLFASPYDNSIEPICICGKIFQHRQSLSRHKTKCGYVEKKDSEEMTKNELLKQLMLQNQQLIFENKEFKELILNQSNKMMELATKPSTINNMNCNNKQQFNLNLFLNEKCKNAMNMSEFVDSIQIMDDDFENIGRLGYVQGISNIFMKGLKDLDETARPMHCSDIKREVLYIKDNDKWDKDNGDKIRKTIAEISHKNVKYIPIWRDANPLAQDGATKKNDQYMQIVNQVMTSITPDDPNGINKIIHNVANMVVIDKKGIE